MWKLELLVLASIIAFGAFMATTPEPRAQVTLVEKLDAIDAVFMPASWGR